MEEKNVYYKNSLNEFERITKEEFDSIPMNWVETAVIISDDLKLKVYIKHTIYGFILNESTSEELINRIGSKWFEWWNKTVYNSGLNLEE